MSRHISEDERAEYREDALREQWDIDHDVREETFFCPNDSCSVVEYCEDAEADEDGNYGSGDICARATWKSETWRTTKATRIQPAEYESENTECPLCGTEGEELPTGSRLDFDEVPQ